jgi:type VI secretion system protein ImpA
LPEDPDLAARRREEAAAMARKFDEAVAATPREFYVTLAEDIQICRQEIERLGKRLDEFLGKLAPGTTTMRAAIDTCDELVRRILRDKPGPPIPQVADESSPTATTNGNGQIAGAMAGPIQSREDAFRRLEEVALFLRRTEPQSPVPYLVDRAVAWGRMPFDQLLSELIKDATQRDQVGELLGIKAPPSG